MNTTLCPAAPTAPMAYSDTLRDHDDELSTMAPTQNSKLPQPEAATILSRQDVRQCRLLIDHLPNTSVETNVCILELSPGSKGIWAYLASYFAPFYSLAQKAQLT